MNLNLKEIIFLHDDCISSGYTKEKLIKVYGNFFSSLINEQKENGKEKRCTLITYGSKYITVIENKELSKIKLKSLGSRQNGSHPVFDSSVKAINETGERYSKTEEDERPSEVIFIIAAFGKDNASKRCTISTLREKIEHQSEVYNWKFIILTDNIDFESEFNTNVIVTGTEDEGYYERCLEKITVVLCADEETEI